jgi:hypothetical protein
MKGMVRRFFGIIVVWLTICPIAWTANGFATQRLQQMANAISDVPFMQLSQGIHTEYDYANNPLIVRINEWNEVEHIGYRLFDSLFVLHQPRLVCDFVERYLLELDLDNMFDRNIRMGVDKVAVENGSMENMHKLLSAERIDLSMVEMRRYRVAWHSENKCLLSLVFDMDYQLLSGCNAIELENNYLRTMGRLSRTYQWKENDVVADSTDKYAIVEGGHYLSEAIRGDRYYQKDSIGEWQLVCNPEKPYWSAANIVLTPINNDGAYQLDCQLDMYGYRDTTFKVNMNQWVAQTLTEGCQLYFGLKSKTLYTIRGIVFCPNPTAGYCHMLSVEIPIEAFENKQGIIRGRLFAYVPLHNIDEGYFDLNYEKPVKM